MPFFHVQYYVFLLLLFYSFRKYAKKQKKHNMPDYFMLTSIYKFLYSLEQDTRGAFIRQVRQLRVITRKEEHTVHVLRVFSLPVMMRTCCTYLIK